MVNITTIAAKRMRAGVCMGVLAVGAIALSCSSVASVPQQARWDFKVLLDNREIGSHYFEIRDTGGQQIVDMQASFDVKVLFVSMYRYRHSNHEVWQDGCLRSINAQTDDNGKQFLVKGRAQPSHFELESARADNALPHCVKTFAYWDPSILREERLLNSQTGVYEDVRVERVGEEFVDVNGEPIAAVKYVLDLKAGPITLWYAKRDYRWLALESLAGGGRILKYEAVSVPDEFGNAQMPSQALMASSAIAK